MYLVGNFKIFNSCLLVYQVCNYCSLVYKVCNYCSLVYKVCNYSSLVYQVCNYCSLVYKVGNSCWRNLLQKPLFGMFLWLFCTNVLFSPTTNLIEPKQCINIQVSNTIPLLLLVLFFNYHINFGTFFIWIFF
jgi:hypothetical protein